MVLGRVGAPFGVQGWVKVTSYTDPPEGIVGYARWTARQGGQSRRSGAGVEAGRARSWPCKLDGRRDHGGSAPAERVREIQVDRAELPAAGAGRVLLHDLLGLEAVNRDGEPLGSVDGFPRDAGAPGRW